MATTPDYPFIRAWGEHLGSSGWYIDDQVAKARKVWRQRQSLAFAVACACGWQPQGRPHLMERDAIAEYENHERQQPDWYNQAAHRQ